MTKISLIEEQNLFRNSLESLIKTYDNCSMIGAYLSIEIFLKTNIDNPPDLILISIYDVHENAAEKIKLLQGSFPLARIIVLSDELDHFGLNLLVELDVFAFFSMSASPKELRALLCNYDKYQVYNQIKIDAFTITHLRSQKSKSAEDKIEFTSRELEVLNLVCQQLTNSEISESLGLSVRTIESFRRRMIIKTNSKNMIGVIMKALQLSDFDYRAAERA